MAKARCGYNVEHGPDVPFINDVQPLADLLKRSKHKVAVMHTTAPGNPTRTDIEVEGLAVVLVTSSTPPPKGVKQ